VTFIKITNLAKDNQRVYYIFCKRYKRFIAYISDVDWLQLKNDARFGVKRYDIDKDVIQLYFDEVC